MSIALLRRHIQEYFWLEIFDAIGQSYKVYADAASSALHSNKDFQHVRMQCLKFDKKSLSKNPETEAEMVAQEQHFAKLFSSLAEDEALFRAEAEAILTNARAKEEDTFRAFMVRSSAYENLGAAYKRTLGKWIDARNHLNDEHLDLVLKQGINSENQKLEAMLQVLKRMVRIRRLYAALEVVMPVAFAISAIIYVRLREI